jgi:integrase/recombinase XerD
MATRRNARGKRVAPGGRTLTQWLPYWENEMGARDCRPGTVQNQRDTIRRAIRHLGDIDPRQLSPEHLAAWRDTLRTEGLKDSTVNRYLLAFGTFLNWLVDESVLDESPAHAVPLLKERDKHNPPVLQRDALDRMAQGATKAVKGRTEFEKLRDAAILSLLQDSGLRASECAGLLCENLDLAGRQAYVHPEIAKGRYGRTVTFGFNTARLLGRYLRMRDEHKYAFLAQVFVGRKGALTYYGMYDLTKAAARRGGVVGARPHLYRHTFAHDMKEAGVSDEVLMSLGGWRTPTMLRAYGRSERESRAVDTYQRVGSPVDRAATSSQQGNMRGGFNGKVSGDVGKAYGGSRRRRGA